MSPSNAYDCSNVDHDLIQVSCTGWNNNCSDGFRRLWVDKANDIKQCVCYRELTAEEAAIRADCKCAGSTAVCVDMGTQRSCDYVMAACSLKYKLQDRKVTWDTTDPYFTPCFENTVLTWLPAAFLVSFAFFDINFSLNSRKREGLPWNPINIGRSLLSIGLLVVGVVHLILLQKYEETSKVENVAVIILALFLLILGKLKGIRASGTQFLFWLLVTLTEGILFRTAVRKYDDTVEESMQRHIYLVRFVIFPLCAGQLIFHCFSDRDKATCGVGKKSPMPFETPCPEKESSFISKITYSWFDSIAWTGYKRPLNFEDLWDLNKDDRADEQVPIFMKYWDAAVETAKAFLVAHVAPQSTEESWKGYLYSGLLILCSILQTIFGVQHMKRMMLLGMRIRTVLSSAIYRKSLIITSASKRDTTAGEIVNLMSVDTQRLLDLTGFFFMALTAPIQIGLSIYFLYNTLGVSVFAGLAVMILLIPYTGFTQSRVRNLQMKQMLIKDQRVKLINEILAGMKVLKLYGWEQSYADQITKLRDREMMLLRRAALYGTSTMFSFTCAPFLVSLSTFAVYVLTDETHNLNAEKTFVSLSLFNILRMPMTMLPAVIAIMIQAMVSVERINRFLNAEELEKNLVTKEKNEAEPVVIKDASFSWTDESVTLADINFSVKKGSLTAVVGTVGSGKTSLLSALLGDLKKHKGSVNIDGSVSYVAQTAWIQNASLRENVLFKDGFQEGKYKSVIDACALGPDLELLENGDQTEIGEKGINLSGGQKQRVSLARAAYKESDIYLWDDPLSAVDAHVGKHIFDKLIGPQGLLSSKTRILVTHGVSFLPKVDKIVVLKDGRVSESGTFQQLLKNRGSFAEFLAQHLDIGEGEEIDESFVEEIGEIVGMETLRRNSSKVDALKRRSTQESIRNRKKGNLVKLEDEKPKLIQAETTAEGNIQGGIIFEYFKQGGFLIFMVGIMFSITSNAASTYANIWLSQWSKQATIDEMERNGTNDRETTDKYLGVYGGLGAAQAVTVLFGAASIAMATLNAAEKLHFGMLRKVVRAPMWFFDTTPLGRLINKFSKDMDTVDIVLPQNLRGGSTILFNTLSAIVSIAYSTPLFLTFIAPVAVFYFFLQRFYVATSRQLKRMESVSRSPIYSKFGETISGSTTIRAFGLQDDFIIESDKKIDDNQQAYYPFIASNLWIATRLEAIGSLIIFAAAMFAVASRESIDPEIVGLSISSALQITALLNFLVRTASDLETNIVAVERISELNSTPQEAPWETGLKPAKEWPSEGKVEFSRYETRYREGLDLVLRGISCTFKPGERIGIAAAARKMPYAVSAAYYRRLGRTGAGKSSLTLALFRLIEPTSGKILIDGQDIAEIGLHDLRKKITIIPQDPVLFSGILRTNLDPFSAHTDQEIWDCLESAHLKSYVSTLPQGLEYEVAEEGQNFSMGQRQLVCLARALLRKTKILVLDEATAAVDLETDDLIQKTIREEFAESTVITIAHRLNTIMDSTRIVVLDKGQIVEFDTPVNLMSDKTTIFYSMAKDAGLTQ
ncbi:Canalicular multispecific organic anion transporter 2 [Folsomia candida]|uniref:ABC-type glutathione-S-conjugate transporter n=1 Tax=Folsomia candida TaxID=158441 RepID=A0A226D9Q1_FOLCA|nr:Canalicular multispecific organic anion transporter 2 [Folsomia candida]